MVRGRATRLLRVGRQRDGFLCGVWPLMGQRSLPGMPGRMLEETLQRNVIELAGYLGWRVAHFRPLRTKYGWRTPVSGDGAGFPDLVLVHPKHGVLWRELKAARGKLSPEQEGWAASLLAADANYAVWTPAHWPGQIQAELRGDA